MRYGGGWVEESGGRGISGDECERGEREREVWGIKGWKNKCLALVTVR